MHAASSDGLDAQPVGRLTGIARRNARRVPMEEVASGEITSAAGLVGDHKGAKFPRRQITVLAQEDWSAAIAELSDLAGAVPLPWTARRANLLVEGVPLPKVRGAILEVGPVVLEVTGPTVPCRRMDEAHPGLLRALFPDWRGGITCLVREGGRIALGDTVRVLYAPPRRTRHLPG